MSKLDDATLTLSRIYREAEDRLLRLLAAQAAAGTSMDVAAWAATKAAETSRIVGQVSRMVGELDVDAARVLSAETAVAWQAGAQGAVPIVGTPAAVARIAEEAAAGLRVAHVGMLRWFDDIYRRVQVEAAGLMATGTNTLQGAVQDALNRYAAAGVKGFVDSAGRGWGLQEYAEMQMRTAFTRAQVNGTLDRFKAQDRNLMIVSESPEPCPICSPWEGVVLAVEPEGDYPTVDEAIGDGLLHPNCTHGLFAFVDGLTQEGRTQPLDEDGYEMRQKQRYHERQVRDAHRRLAVATTPDAQRRAEMLMSNRRDAYRSFVSSNDRIPVAWRTRVLDG